MARLPPHHIQRPRLTDRCRDERIVVVEAAGGYGKSVLAAELVEMWGALPIWVALEEGGVPARLLASRLRGAVASAGLTDASAAMAAAGDDPPGAVDAMLAALTGESVAIVFDDAHHAARDAAGLIDRIADQLAGQQRLVVLARGLPAGVPHLRRADVLNLRAADLALRPEETLELCRRGFGLEVSDDEGRQLDAFTGGWTAAAALAASIAMRTSQRVGAVARANGPHSDALAAILGEAVSTLGVAPERLAQLGFLPLLDTELMARVGGEPGFLERSLASGLPLTRSDGDWWQLPGPVRDLLTASAPVDSELLRAAAAHYRQRGELSTALQMVLGAGEPAEAAQLLSDADAVSIETVDALELLSVVDRIPVAVLDGFPRAILHAARSAHAANLLRQRGRLLARLEPLAGSHPKLMRAWEAERAVDLSTSGTTPGEAEALARRVVASATGAEELTRARALSVIGKAIWWQRDEHGLRSVARMREAADYFNQAAEILRGLGQRAAVASLAIYRAMWIDFELGRADSALEILNEALALSVDVPRRYTAVVYYRARVLTELGRHDESEADLEEVLRIARQLGDPGSRVAYVHWERFRRASMRGDADATVLHVQQTEAHRSDWWEHGRFDFLAEAADCLRRVGKTALAWEYLERVQAEPGDAGHLIAMAEGALLASDGDPELAEQRLRVVDRQGVTPRELWRATLLRAYAASRRGDSAAGALAARAFDEAARLGQPQLPLIQERELTESLLALAVQIGSTAAAALEASELPLALSLLGRFELSEGGRPLPIGRSEGQAAQLLKLVAVSGGELGAERAIEALWPEVDPATGRNRLRTVLGRLREAAGEVVRREGERLVLREDVRVDLAQFQRDAREALALARGDRTAGVAVARSAIARYRGDLLPHDLYEEWADTPRESARRTMLDLLDLCAGAAAERGDLDEARRLVERTIELAPFEDDRYLRVAEILQAQGRRGAALSVLRRARATLATLGLELPAEASELLAS